MLKLLLERLEEKEMLLEQKQRQHKPKQQPPERQQRQHKQKQLLLKHEHKQHKLKQKLLVLLKYKLQKLLPKQQD